MDCKISTSQKNSNLFTLEVDLKSSHYDLHKDYKNCDYVKMVSLELRSVDHSKDNVVEFSVNGITFYFTIDSKHQEGTLVALKNMSSLVIMIDDIVHYNSAYKAKTSILLSLGHTYTIKINNKEKFSFDCYYVN